MIPDCVCLRHSCSSPAAVEAAPPLAMAQMHGGLVLPCSWPYVSALPCGGSLAWFTMGVFGVPDLVSARPVAVTPLQRMYFRLW